MSTRSVIAVQEGDGWKGRYVHSDGYPTAKVPELLALVERDGLDTVVRRITKDRYGWSSLNPEQPDITGVAPYEGRLFGEGAPAYGSAEYVATMLAPGNMYGDGRFANEPGYGMAYTTVSGQSDPDEWITHDGDNWGTEWAYVLNDIGFSVMKGSWKDEGWELVGFVRWGSDAGVAEEMEASAYESV